MASNRGEAGEVCRRVVVNLLRSGKTQEETAELVELSQSAVSRIWKRFNESGEEGLAARNSPGAPAKLSPEQKAMIPELLFAGPEVYGFEGNLWTRRRVQTVIREKLGITYCESHIGVLLKEVGFSLQKPHRRDYRQKPEKVREWREETLPELKKKALDEARILVYVDEAGFNLMPSSGQTWSPVGQTPRLEQGCRYKHLSMISAVTETGGFYSAIQEESFTGATVTDFLRCLAEEIDYPLVVVWDNASIHRAQEVKAFLSEENAGRIHLAAQPSYSPELNADEQAWNWLKYHQLKNVCCKTLAELREKVQAAAKKLRSSPHLIRGFFSHPELGFFMTN